MPWSPDGLPPKDGFKNKPSDHETRSIRCHVGKDPCGLFTHILHHLHTHSVGPSSVTVRRSKLGPAPPFPPMRVLGVRWSRALSLMALNHLLLLLLRLNDYLSATAKCLRGTTPLPSYDLIKLPCALSVLNCQNMPTCTS